MGLVFHVHQRFSKLTQQAALCNQFVRFNLLLLNQRGGDLEGGFFLGCTNRPGLYAVTQGADKINFLIPDGREVNLHAVEVQSHHHHGATGTCPTQGVMRCALAGHCVIDDIVAAHKHLVALKTFIELSSGSKLHLLIAVSWIDNPGTHTCGTFHLKSVACQYMHLSVWSKGADDL